MNDNSISTHERALYVAACLLSQQDIKNKAGNVLKKGLIPDDLTSQDDENYRDSVKIKNHIDEFLRQRDLDQEKVKLMIDAFTRISINALRDKKKHKHKLVEKLLKEESSVNKQIFTYIYENIYKEINILNKNSKFYDVMGELYNEFLKYAMTDGKMGIVLTPSYVTKMMVQILEINADSKVMDLATGSAGFLIAAMDLMIDFARNAPNQNAKSKNEKIATIKQSQLLGVEENTDMFALATTNMILRGDGSSKIIQNDSFLVALELKEFKADRILLNPPFSYKENGMPFIKQGLDNMPRYALGAIIIQDSAGSGKARETNQDILKHHTLKASIKMPMDLFVPMAGVQTSIYIFEAQIPHDYEKPVKFIDFRNDGYKRTEKALQEVDNPIQRYIDILKIYKQGLNARIDNSVYKEPINLSEAYVEDFITDSGADWNFDQHKKIDTTPTLQDFKKCVSEYLAWEVSNVLKNSTQGGAANGETEGNASSPRLVKLEKEFKQNGGAWREFKIGELFEKKTIKGVPKQAENLTLNPNGYHMFGQNIKYQHPQKILLDEKYLCRIEKPILAYTSSVGEIGIIEESFYRSGDNGAFQGLFPKFEAYNKLHILFILTILQKQFDNFGYATSMSDVINLKLSLPILPTPCHTEPLGEVSSNTESRFFANAQNAVFLENKRSGASVARQVSLENDKINIESNNYQIAFDYMESYIKALEAYLKVTGLNDYNLTTKEKEALKAFECLNSGGGGVESTLDSTHLPLRWQSFKIGELFEIKPTKAYKMTNTTLFETKGDVPVVTNSSLNNGVSAYVGLDPTEKGNMITYSDTTTSEGIFYQPRDFVGYSHIQGLYPLVHKDKWNRYSLLYFVSVFRKASFGKFDYGNKFNRKIAKEMRVLLPILDSKNINFDFMESFIKAIQKECIKSVVLWQKREVKAYKQVLEKQ